MLFIAGCGTTAEPAVSSDAVTQAPAETAPAVADNSDDKFVSAYPAFTVTSESLDGKYWVEACANTAEDAQPWGRFVSVMSDDLQCRKLFVFISTM